MKYEDFELYLLNQVHDSYCKLEEITVLVAGISDEKIRKRVIGLVAESHTSLCRNFLAGMETQDYFYTESGTGFLVTNQGVCRCEKILE